MKKITSLFLAAAMVVSFAACNSAASSTSTSTSSQASESSSSAPAPTEPASSAPEAVSQPQAEEPTEVTVTGVDAAGEEVQVTVPYKPEKVVVLDLANLDILDNLGLGDCVVGAPTITLPYLQSYNNDLPIVGSVKTPDLEAVMACEPDLILMGGRMAEYYEQLGEIAPTLRLITDNTTLGEVESVRRNATTIGSIFGETEQVDALLDQYDTRIAALAAFADGKTCVLGMCTSGSFNLLGNDGRCSLIVNEIGFNNIGASAAAASTSGGRGGSSENGGGRGGRGENSSSTENSGGSTPTHGNEVSFEAIVSLNPEYIFVMDRDSAISATGAQLAQEIMENELIMKTDAYKNGNLVILENPGIWYLAEGGITALDIMLQDLESVLLK